MSAQREMNLEEVANQYGPQHRAAKELAELRAQLAAAKRRNDGLDDELQCVREELAALQAQVAEADAKRYTVDLKNEVYPFGSNLRASPVPAAVPDGWVMCEIGVLSERCLDAAIKDAGIARDVCEDLDVVLSAGIHAYLLAAAQEGKKP